MKSFRISFSPIVFALLALVILLTGAGVGWNIFNIIHAYDTFKIVIYVITGLLSLVLFICAVAVIFYSRYSFKNKKLIATFGIIPSSYDLSKAVRLTHFKISDKLVLYFSDATYTTILIKSQYYADFSSMLKSECDYVIIDSEDENSAE